MNGAPMWIWRSIPFLFYIIKINPPFSREAKWRINFDCLYITFILFLRLWLRYERKSRGHLREKYLLWYWE